MHSGDSEQRSSPHCHARTAANWLKCCSTESGAEIVEFNRPSAYDELVLETTPLWRRRRVRVRVATHSIEQRDVDRLVERVTEAGDAEGLLIAPLDPVIPALEIPGSVSAISACELAERMERSALIAWPNRKPVPAYDRVTTQRHLERDAAFLDPVGLRWLPVVAFNELPLDLAKEHLLPQEALERLAFRLMTSVFRLGGERYGESMPRRAFPMRSSPSGNPAGNRWGRFSIAKQPLMDTGWIRITCCAFSDM